jgi:hypothetical protein
MRSTESDMNFTVDHRAGSKNIGNPSWGQIEESLQNIDGENCCFFILTADSGSYLQCAGGQRAVTLEFREIANGNFKHFILGKGQVKNALKTVWSIIDCRVGPIRVHKDEVLTLGDAKGAFTYFFQTSDIPPSFTRRNVTKHFRPLAS